MSVRSERWGRTPWKCQYYLVDEEAAASGSRSWEMLIITSPKTCMKVPMASGRAGPQSLKSLLTSVPARMKKNAQQT